MSENIFCPDFIIAGAMKCGTSTIYHILNDHPDIFIPKNEIGFWDADDMLTHPDFDQFIGDKWKLSRISQGQKRKWYKDRFSQVNNE